MPCTSKQYKHTHKGSVHMVNINANIQLDFFKATLPTPI